MNMTMVFCKRMQKEMPALSQPPIQGELGQLLLTNICEDAWNEWLEMQIKIINEERLDLSDESAQERLFVSMIDYLGLQNLIH